MPSNICPVPPDAERGTCDCGREGIATQVGKKLVVVVCDECREYFSRGFNVIMHYADIRRQQATPKNRLHRG